MLWILAVGGVLGVFYIIGNDIMEMGPAWDWDDFCYFAKRVVIPILIAVIGIVGLCHFNMYFSYEETLQTAEYDLVSIKDNSEVEGSGSGNMFYVYVSMDTSDVYTYYYRLENGGYKKGKISSENTIVYEQDDCAPKVIKYTTYKKFDMSPGLEKFLTFASFRDSENSYEIFVPTGTIVHDYYLNAE